MRCSNSWLRLVPRAGEVSAVRGLCLAVGERGQALLARAPLPTPAP